MCLFTLNKGFFKFIESTRLNFMFKNEVVGISPFIAFLSTVANKKSRKFFPLLNKFVSNHINFFIQKNIWSQQYILYIQSISVLPHFYYALYKAFYHFTLHIICDEQVFIFCKTSFQYNKNFTTCKVLSICFIFDKSETTTGIPSLISRKLKKRWHLCHRVNYPYSFSKSP